MNLKRTTKFRLRFFFDYGSGGCLWSDNEAAYEKFGAGVLNTAVFDLDGNKIEEEIIKLPEFIQKKVLYLSKLYDESLNWEDPAGESKWDQAQWDFFHKQTRELYNELSKICADEFEIIYKQE